VIAAALDAGRREVQHVSRSKIIERGAERGGEVTADDCDRRDDAAGFRGETLQEPHPAGALGGRRRESPSPGTTDVTAAFVCCATSNSPSDVERLLSRSRR
jgi:hypothetical protein